MQRPGVEPVIFRDLVIFRALGALVNTVSRQRLGCNAELIVDEFGEKLLEELDYLQVGGRLRLAFAVCGDGQGACVWTEHPTQLST